MNQESHESLSAAVDGELSDFELRRLLDRVSNEPDLTKKWSRYHLSQQLLQGSDVGGSGSTSMHNNMDLVSRVSLAIQQEDTYSEVDQSLEQSAKTPWWKPAASMAVAASVTFMVVLGGQSYFNQPSIDDSSIQPAFTIPTIANRNNVMQTGFGETTLPQGVKRYVEQHQTILENTTPHWSASWLPEGFKPVRHQVMSDSNMVVFSDGQHSLSIHVEPFGKQDQSAGIVTMENLVAVGVKQGDQLVTVVGDVPVKIAERIAHSVQVVR